MKLARFDGGRIGVVRDDMIFDVSAACNVDPGEWPPVGIVRVIADWAKLRSGIESAVANAKHDGADVDLLFVSKATVDKGPNKFNRRWRPRAMGRATKVTKGISHIVIELDERK